MRIRSALLVACMVVVPLIAMFSHRVPAQVRASIRDAVWERIAAITAPESPGQAPKPAEPAAHAVAAEPIAPAALAPVAAAPGAVDTEQRDTETRLAALGATAIECHALPGTGHAASCRVAVDATGQLHRLFQAAGPGPGDALRGLLADVSAWRHRLAVRPESAAASPAGGPAPARVMNF